MGEFADLRMGEYANMRMGEFANGRICEFADLRHRSLKSNQSGAEAPHSKSAQAPHSKRWRKARETPSSRLGFHHLPALVIAAIGAYLMRKPGFAAIGAVHQLGTPQFPLGPTAAGVGTGHLLLGNGGHGLPPMEKIRHPKQCRPATAHRASNRGHCRRCRGESQGFASRLAQAFCMGLSRLGTAGIKEK